REHRDAEDGQRPERERDPRRLGGLAPGSRPQEPDDRHDGGETPGQRAEQRHRQELYGRQRNVLVGEHASAEDVQDLVVDDGVPERTRRRRFAEDPPPDAEHEARGEARPGKPASDRPRPTGERQRGQDDDGRPECPERILGEAGDAERDEAPADQPPAAVGEPDERESKSPRERGDEEGIGTHVPRIGEEERAGQQRAPGQAAVGATEEPCPEPRRPVDRRDDNYVWLRDKDDPHVTAYLEAENAYTAAVMQTMEAYQDALYREILGRIKENDATVPYRSGNHFYYSRTKKGKQYPIHCRKAARPDEPEEILLDLNALAVGHPFLALGAYAVNDDADRLAYTLDHTGFREYTLFVKNLTTGELEPDRIEKVSTVAWSARPGTLLYVSEDAAKRPYRLWRHRLGDASDDLIF